MANNFKVRDLIADNVTIDGNINGGLSSDFVKGDGSLDDNIYLTSEDLNSNIILYPTTTESDVEGYRLMVSSITDVAYDDPAVNVPTGPIDSDDTYISSIISREGLIVGDLDTINMTVIGRIRKTSGSTNKNATFHFHVYKRDDVGNETEIGLSGDTLTVESSLYEEYSASVLLPASTWLPTDKLVLKLYGILIGSGGGASPTYDFEFGGDTPVRVLIPLPTSVQLSNYVPYIGSSKDLYLGVHTVNTAAVYTNDIINDGAALTIKTNNGQPLNFETNNVQRMSITSAGNVGIGTTTPTSRLHIKSSGTTSATSTFKIDSPTDTQRLLVRDDGRVFIGNGTSTNSVSILNVQGEAFFTSNVVTNGGIFANTYSAPAGSNLRLTTYNGPYVFITNDLASGFPLNFGIGTTTPNERLTVNGNANISGNVTANNLVYNTGNQTISGIKDFQSIPLVSGEEIYYKKNIVYFTGNNFTPNADLARTFEYVLTGLAGASATLNAPINMHNGENIVIKIKQSPSGSNHIIFNSNYKFPGGVIPSLTLTPDKADIYTALKIDSNFYSTYIKDFIN
jgi:hypothetical protein